MEVHIKDPYCTICHSIPELEKLVGQQVGLTTWFTITQDQIDAYGKLTNDEQWIHCDPQKAAAFSPYGTTVAHGFYVLSLAPQFLYETFRVEQASMLVNYGTDRVRFPNATPCGGNIRARLEMLSYEAKETGAKIKLKMTFELEGQEKPACVAELLSQCFF